MRWGSTHVQTLGAMIAIWLAITAPVWAHHGGLGIEGDIVEWSMKVDQWQQEELTNGHRVKFLAYPRNATAQRTTRLVFEVQSVTTGRYVGGLAATVIIRTPQGDEHVLAAPESPGVTAYYEVPFAFPMAGEHAITFQAHADGRELTAFFVQRVSANPLFGDWRTMLGNGAILTAFMVTWIGAVLALQRRLLSAMD